MRIRTRAALCAAAALLFCARRDAGDTRPARASPPPEDAAGLSRATVRFDTARGPWLVEVEVAGTPEQRARGLMFRTGLAPDHGMLFVFGETEEHGFWMHNTLLSLDMIFLAEDRTVEGVVANAVPRTDVTRTIGKPSRYVVEVSGGEAAAHAIAPGTRVAFVGVHE
ncbi:MAG: hypothetical protein NVS4B10_17110 [Myxococcales bacterium]